MPSKIEPYPFQRAIAESLLRGSNVILQAPTGSGKTHAALLPFLTALEKNFDFPRKCLYSVPMRVLAKQFVDDYTPLVRKAGRDDKIRVAIQTGDQARDAIFASDLIFATIDQTLSSFLLAPYSQSRSKANLNAAAVMSAYLVFDEFHLFDPASMLPTTLHMLRMLRGITPFILMTATFSENMLDDLADLLGAVVIPGNEAELEQLRTLESQQKTRRYHLIDAQNQPLSADRVLAAHDTRSLVICNTVDRARRIHQELSDATQDTDIRVLLLHSRFLREDRDRIEDTIRDYFGKESTPDGNFIVISTQAIEVGVDITSTRLHTELAPANAILQRAGRCARYPGNEGDVFIYRYVQGDEPGEPIDLPESVNPYKDQQDEFERTLRAFQDRPGATLDFTDEQDVITTVHGPSDQRIIEQIRVERAKYRGRIFGVMARYTPEDAPNLVRNIDQQQVTIHDDPDAVAESPFDVPSFGLHPGTLQKYVRLWLDRAGELELDDAIFYLKKLKDEAYEYAVQANLPVYTCEPVRTPETVKGSPLVIVHPLLATYDPERGFLPDEGDDWTAPLPTRDERPQRDPYTYRLETYRRHIELVWEAAFDPRDGFWHEMAWLAQQMEQKFEWKPGSIRRAAELAVLLHDVGKLNIKWQDWVKEYQQKIGVPIEKGEVYAHTELQTDTHREIEKGMHRRPWHAVESAISALPTIMAELGHNVLLIKAIFTAIARHHSADSDSNQEFQLVDHAIEHVKASLQGDGFSVQLHGVSQRVPANFGAKDAIPDPRKEHKAFLSYLVLARVLRRADQEGTRKGSSGV